MNRDDELPMWTVYKNPSDYPGKYVVRRSVAGPGGTLRHDPFPIVVAETIEEARLSLPQVGLHCIPRYAEDDPVIVEVWL